MRNLELWHSVALNSEIIRRTKKLTRERKLPLLVLQRLSQECHSTVRLLGCRLVSVRYLFDTRQECHSTVRLLGCRLVSVRYLFDTRQPFSFDDFEGKWSLNGTFFRYLPRHFSRRHRFKCHDHIWRKDSWTGVWFCGQKNPRGWQLPFCSHASKIFLNVVAPWSVHVCQIWSGSVKVCWSYSRKIVFFRPRNHYNIGWSLYTGFQRRDRIDSALTFWSVGQCAVYGGIMTSRPAALSEIEKNGAHQTYCGDVEVDVTSNAMR